jgi:hypothetical protein
VLYPNPSAGELNVRLIGGSVEAMNVEVFDATGRLVLSERAGNSAHRIDASALLAGSYRVVVMDGDRSIGGATWIKQ